MQQRFDHAYATLQGSQVHVRCSFTTAELLVCGTRLLQLIDAVQIAQADESQARTPMRRSGQMLWQHQ